MQNSSVIFSFTAQEIIDEGRVTSQNIEQIKSWLLTQKLPDLTDEQIILFLLSCRNHQEQTRTTISKFYSIRAASPTLFNNRKVSREDLQQQLRIFEFCVSPERTDNGSTVIISRLRHGNYQEMNMEHCLVLCFMMLERVFYDHPPNSLIVLLDFKLATLMHLTKLRMGCLKVLFQYVQYGLPLFVERCHVLNTPSFADRLMSIVKPFLSKENVEMIKFYPANMDMEWFYENVIPKRCLPENYGGDLPSIDTLMNNCIQKLINMEGYFEAEEMQRRKNC